MAFRRFYLIDDLITLIVPPFADFYLLEGTFLFDLDTSFSDVVPGVMLSFSLELITVDFTSESVLPSDLVSNFSIIYLRG